MCVLCVCVCVSARSQWGAGFVCLTIVSSPCVTSIVYACVLFLSVVIHWYMKGLMI